MSGTGSRILDLVNKLALDEKPVAHWRRQARRSKTMTLVPDHYEPYTLKTLEGKYNDTLSLPTNSHHDKIKQLSFYELQEHISRDQQILYEPPVVNDAQLQNFKQFCKHPLKPKGDKIMRMQTELKKFEHLPIHLRVLAATNANNPWAIEHLFLQGCPVDHVDERGYTALHVASGFGFFECAKILVNCGHPINPTTIYGYTPMYIAKAANAVFIYMMLKKEGGVLAVNKSNVTRYESVLDIDQRPGRKNTCEYQIARFGNRRRPYYQQF